jgi:murein DD-endopeptidase MepM/ murein hydrolase activator NlpD
MKGLRHLVLAAALVPPSAARAQSPRLTRLLRAADSLALPVAPAAESLRVRVDRLARVPALAPVPGVVTSGFAARRIDPIDGRPAPHRGVDLAGQLGAVIRAPAAGRVTAAGTAAGYGRYVLIDHGDGIVTRYAHCAALLVQRGKRVARGDPIALVGSTGRSTAPHLHYEILRRGRPVNPSDFPH